MITINDRWWLHMLDDKYACSVIAMHDQRRWCLKKTYVCMIDDDKYEESIINSKPAIGIDVW